MEDSHAETGALWWWTLLLLGGAWAITLYIYNTGHNPANITFGCAENGSCAAVVQSEWAWFGPLSLSTIGLFGYSFCLVCLLGMRLVPPPLQPWGYALLLLSGAGGIVFSGWLIGIQHVMIKKYCLYCMSAHALGILGFGLLLRHAWKQLGPGRIRKTTSAAAPFTSALLIALHILLPVDRVRVSAGETAADSGASYQSTGLQFGQPKKSRTVSFLSDKIQLDTYQVPTAGNPEADCVIVKLFDYSCPACRRLHVALSEYAARETTSLCVVSFPVPMHPDCNPGVHKFHSGFQYSCELTRLALAVYVADRDQYGSFHDQLLGQGKTISPKAARIQADRLVGKEAVDRALKDPRIEQLLQDGLALYNYIGAKSIPRLLIGDQVVEYGGGSPRQILELLEAMQPCK